jgi:hypothetical protein
MAAPATAIIAYDPEFYDKLPRLFAYTDARSWFAGTGYGDPAKLKPRNPRLSFEEACRIA